MNEKYSTQLNKLQEINEQIKNNKLNQGEIKTKVIELNQELEKSNGIDAFKKINRTSW